MTGIEELAAAAMAAIPEGTGTALATAATAAAASAGVNALMAPKPPGVRTPAAMPDQQNQEMARRRALIEQMARRGRQSTILSDPADSDPLG